MDPGQDFELPLPAFVQVEPVGEGSAGCNRPPAFMALDTFRRLLEEFPVLGELHFDGRRDPLLHPCFFDMVRLAVGRGIAVSATSSLAMLGERRAEECVASGLRRLDVIVDGAPLAGCVLRSLNRLAAAKASCGSAGPLVRLVVPLRRSNVQQLPELVRLAAEVGAAGVLVASVADPSPRRLTRKQLELETPDAADAERVATSFAAARAVADQLRVALERQANGRCRRPWRAAYISCSGEATACERPMNGHGSLGDVRRDGVLRVWRGDAYRAFREQLASDEPPELCHGCALSREPPSYAASLSLRAPVTAASASFQSATKR